MLYLSLFPNLIALPRASWASRKATSQRASGWLAAPEGLGARASLKYPVQFN
jgi:hypothetical protein